MNYKKLILIFLNITIILINICYAKTAEWITLPNNKAKALVYLPKEFNPNQTYPLLMALHGMKQTPEYILNKWKPIADELNMILICPKGSNFNEGYVRQPKDDRKNLSLFFQIMTKKYNINEEKSILAGFSRGGNFAIETALVYPTKFKKVICIFGYFLPRHHAIIAQNIANKGNIYQQSQFYFITGFDDTTEYSQALGYYVMKKYNIPVKINIYPNLSHNFPPKLASTIAAIAESSEKEQQPLLVF